MSRARPKSAILTLVCWLAAAGCGEPPASDSSASPPPASRSPNVVVVVLDAARADHFGAYGYARETTPRADAFAGHAIRYARVLSEASYTFLSTSSLFSGGNPASTGLGARSGGRVPDELELLAEVARDHGYATVGYSENPYVTRYFGLDQGFSSFEEAWPTDAFASGHEPSSGFDSERAIDRAVATATRDRARPFFLYLHLLRPHNPYSPPEPFAGRFGSTERERPMGATGALLGMDARSPELRKEEIRTIRRLYDENLAYGDALFGGVLDTLEARDLLDDTVVVLTSDHGEAFGEHGRLLHATQVYDEMLWVPLLVRAPGVSSGVVTTPIQLADLGRGLRRVVSGSAPELLARLGEERDPEAPLFSWTNAGSARLAAWTPRRRLLLDLRTQEAVALYDLEADPGSLAAIPFGSLGDRLLSAARSEADRWTGAHVDAAALSIDPVKRAQLRALGYEIP